MMGEVAKTGPYTSVSFDSIMDQATANNDPAGYISRLKKPVIIDEVQRVPEVFLPIKQDVDTHPGVRGRFALTGSANPLLAPKLGDALTGRMALLQLWPLSQGELLGRQETFLDRVFEEDLGLIEEIPFSRDELIEKLFLGGFPGMHLASDGEACHAWCDSYLSLTLQKDIQQLAQIDGLVQMPNLLYHLATRIGSTLNMSSLSNASDLSYTSLRRYMQLLHSLFLLHTVPAWSKNLTKRMVKSPKVYFVDTAILLHTLRFNEERLTSNLPMLGVVTENFVINELCKQLSWHTRPIKMYHCRFNDHKTEIDIVLEDENGKVVAIEVKSSETVRPDDFKHFSTLENAIGDDLIHSIVLYAGSRKIPFGPKRWAMPISSLWN